MRDATLTFNASRVDLANRAVSGEPVALLEELHGGRDVRVVGVVVERRRRGELTGGREPLADQNHARVARARLQRGTRRHDRPAARFRHLPQAPELLLQPGVDEVIGFERVDGPGGRRRRFQLGECRFECRSPDARVDVPPRIEGDRLDLAVAHVIDERGHGIREKDLKVGLGLGRRGFRPGGQEALDGRKVVVGGRQPVLIEPADGGENRLRILRSRPRGLEGATLEERRNRSGLEQPAPADHACCGRVAYRFDAGAQWLPAIRSAATPGRRPSGRSQTAAPARAPLSSSRIGLACLYGPRPTRSLRPDIRHWL